MKQVKDASQLFVADVKRDQTVKFINFDLIRSFRNHFLINFVFQDAVFAKPTKYFTGEAEAFLLTPILQMFEQFKISARGGVLNKTPFNDVAVANTLMRLAQNAANFSSLMEVSKSSYYAGRAFSEQTLLERLKADWSLENDILSKKTLDKTGKPDPNAPIDWMATLFGQPVNRKAISPITSVELTSWESFAKLCISTLGLGPGFYTEQRNIAPFVAQRSELENMFYGINFPGFHELTNSDDAFYIMALMYLDYCHITSSPEAYQTAMRPEAPNTPQRMDAMATRVKRFMKYYSAMAIAPRFMSMYAKYLLVKDLNVVLTTWTDNELSDNKDMAHKMDVIDSLCKSIVPDRFLKHTEDIIRWFKDFYGVALLLPLEYKILADFAGLKSFDKDEFLVKAGDPVIQSVLYKDKILSQKDLMNLCMTRDQYIDVMYHACLSLDSHIQQIDKSITTVQAWNEFVGFDLPTIPAATEFGTIKFASPIVQLIVNDAVPRNMIDYVHAEKGGISPKRGFMGNIDILPIIKNLVFGTIKPNVWLSFLRGGAIGKRPSGSFNPSDVRITFTNDHTLFIGSRPMAHYAEMPIPVDYLAYADPLCVDASISGLLSILQTLPSPYKALSDYFSAAASQFDMQYNLADLASSFAAVGFWFKGGLTNANKESDFNENWIRPSTNFIYGVPTEIFYAKQLEDIKKAAYYNANAVVVRSSATDNEYTFVMHTQFPVLSELFFHAQTFCDGFIADIPVLGTEMLEALRTDDAYSMTKFREIVVQGSIDGLTTKSFTWFKFTGWSKYTAVLPHMTFRVSSQSSALSDKIINDPDIMKRFCVMAYSNDKEIRPISRSFMNAPLVYIEPDDLMVSRDTSLQLIKAKIADLSDSLSKRAEEIALKHRPPAFPPSDVENKDENMRRDLLTPGHDAGIIPNEPKPKPDDQSILNTPLRDAGASDQITLDSDRKPILKEKKKVYSPPSADEKPGKGDVIIPDAVNGASGASQNSPGSPLEDKKKKKIKRIKPDGSSEVIEVESDYTLAEGEEFVE